MDLSNENVVHVKKNGVEYLQFRKLLEFSDCINHAYSLGKNVNFRTINLKEASKDDVPVLAYNNLCSSIGSNYINVVKPNQTHTDEVKIVSKKINENSLDINCNEYRNTDGLITNKKGIVLSTTNADCILLLFFDPKKKVIANIHSGWRGTSQRISVKTVRKMRDVYGCKPEDIICCICPSIRKCHFEVHKDVFDVFSNEFKEVNNFIEEKVPDFKWYIDTVKINKCILENEGLKRENIVDSGICTMCNSDVIHSYRADGKNFGLETAVIELATD